MPHWLILLWAVPGFILTYLDFGRVRKSREAGLKGYTVHPLSTGVMVIWPITLVVLALLIGIRRSVRKK